MNIWDVLILLGLVGVVLFFWLIGQKRGHHCDGCCSNCLASCSKRRP